LTGTYFGGSKPEKKGFLRISFFPVFFQSNFSQERGFGGGCRNFCFWTPSQDFFAGIPVGQEFLFLVGIPSDSSGFLFPPKADRLRPATKEGSLLSKIWTKIDLFNISP